MWKIKLISLLIISLLISPYLLAKEAPKEVTIYIIELANKHRIYASEYNINENNNTLTYKGILTDFVATFPLDRLNKISEVKIKRDGKNKNYKVVINKIFQNEKSVANVVDDGGILCNFYVVSSRGGRRTSTSRKRTAGKKRFNRRRGPSYTLPRRTIPGSTYNPSSSRGRGNLPFLPSPGTGYKGGGSSGGSLPPPFNRIFK